MTSWTSSLSAHPIFAAPDGTAEPCIAQLRGCDLVVATGKQLRITSLADAKSKFDKASSSAAQPPNAYKTLLTPEIAYTINGIVPNPSSKLLAVYGRSQISIVTLPRKGWNTLVAPTLDAKTTAIGPFYYTSASAKIVSVRWHPLGFNETTLLVLTSDGLLREFDLATDTEEPAQVLNFTSSTQAYKTTATHSSTSYGDKNKPSNQSVDLSLMKKAGKAFGASDDEGSIAVSFCFGKGSSDWGPLTIFGLMQNGDIYAICPYMPKNASISLHYLHALSHFISAKIEYNAESRAYPPNRLATQLRYVKHLLSQSRSSSNDEMEVDAPIYNTQIHLSPLAADSRSAPIRQGPFLLQPAPEELGDDEPAAKDIAYICGDEQGDIGILAIAFEDGRIDITLEVEKIEAQWSNTRSDDDDLPTLAMYESVDLGFSDNSSVVKFTVDPLYFDNLYVLHNFGGHAILITKWYQRLTNALALEDEEQACSKAEKAVRGDSGSQVVCIIKTSAEESIPLSSLTIVQDVYLGYVLLCVTAHMQLVAIELSLRPPAASAANGPPVKKALPPSDDSTHYQSLISSPYSAPPLLAKPSLATRPRHATSSQKLKITPDTLRFLGTTIQDYRYQVRDIVSAANNVQSRLQMQRKEFNRQLEKLKDASDTTTNDIVTRESQIEARCDQISKKQEILNRRADRLLQRLMDESGPTLSVFEKKWFDELQRMRSEVQANDQGTNLTNRAQKLTKQFEYLKPQLEKLLVKTQDNIKVDPGVLGGSQMRQVLGLLAEESKLIANVKAKADRLGARLPKSSS